MIMATFLDLEMKFVQLMLIAELRDDGWLWLRLPVPERWISPEDQRGFKLDDHGHIDPDLLFSTCNLTCEKWAELYTAIGKQWGGWLTRSDLKKQVIEARKKIREQQQVPMVPITPPRMHNSVED